MARNIATLLHSPDGDPGCLGMWPRLDAYVELEAAGEDAAAAFPAVALHLSSCAGCRTDHDGLLAAVRRFGDVTPD